MFKIKDSDPKSDPIHSHVQKAYDTIKYFKRILFYRKLYLKKM